LLELIDGESRLIPQFVVNPAADDFERFAASAKEAGVRSVRILPRRHGYPFRHWVMDDWLDWAIAESLSLWIPAEEIDPNELYDTLKAYLRVKVVLYEVHYVHLAWALPLLRCLPQVAAEISRVVTTDGIPLLMRTVGRERLLFGSRFPDSPMAPQLYALHHCNLDEGSLRAICGGNLERLLKKYV
jgi:predicted TIM-barrel fold metal-dependent hydrolase